MQIFNELEKNLKEKDVVEENLIKKAIFQINETDFWIHQTQSVLDILTQPWADINIIHLNSPGINTAAFVLAVLDLGECLPQNLKIYYVRKYREIHPNDNEKYDILTEELLQDYELGHLANWRDIQNGKITFHIPTNTPRRFFALKEAIDEVSDQEELSEEDSYDEESQNESSEETNSMSL